MFAKARRSDSQECDRSLRKYLQLWYLDFCALIINAPWLKIQEPNSQYEEYGTVLQICLLPDIYKSPSGSYIKFSPKIFLSREVIWHEHVPYSPIYLRQVAIRYRFSGCVTKRFGSSFTVTPTLVRSREARGPRHRDDASKLILAVGSDFTFERIGSDRP